MLNFALAALATLLWSVAYGWYFAPDLRRWWRGRRARRTPTPGTRLQRVAASPQLILPQRPAPRARPASPRRGPDPLFPPPPPLPVPARRDNVVAFPARPQRRPDSPGRR